MEINKNNEQLALDEKRFLKAAKAITEITNLDGYSPYVRTVFKVVDLLSYKPNSDYDEILKWLKTLNPNLLSDEPLKYTDGEGKEQEFLPDREKWYSSMTKALFEAGLYEECIDISEKAFNELSKFFYNNEIWIERRRALSYGQIGKKERAIQILSLVAQKKPEWFICYELSKLHFDLDQLDKAFEYGIEAALIKGKTENKWKLYQHLGNILKTKDEIEFANLHYHLVEIIRIEKGWTSIPGLNKIGIESGDKNIGDKRTILRSLQNYWERQKYRNLDEIEGKIVKILSHGKSGFIKSNQGKDYFFKKKNFIDDYKLMISEQPVLFHFVESFDKKHNKKSFEAINIRTKKDF